MAAELGWLDILKNATKDFKISDVLSGLGSVAGAFGTYKTGKEQNKITRDMLNYTMAQDKKEEDKIAQAQTNLDTAVDNVYGTKKKKTDLSLAYGTPSTEV